MLGRKSLYRDAHAQVKWGTDLFEVSAAEVLSSHALLCALSGFNQLRCSLTCRTGLGASFFMKLDIYCLRSKAASDFFKMVRVA